MLFFFDYIKNLINDYKKERRKRPNKLKYIVIWITLIILLTVIFYYLGCFNKIKSKPLKKNILDSQILESNIKPLNKISFDIVNTKPINNIIPVKKEISNTISEMSDVKPEKIIGSNNKRIIDEILEKVSNIPKPLNNYINEYNDYNI